MPVVLLFVACHTVERPVPPRIAEVRIVVDDTAATLSTVIASVEASGGHVVQSDVRREQGVLRASVILQVPQHELMRTLARIRGEAKMIERERVSERGDAPPSSRGGAAGSARD